jgi:hypothetical protein
MSRKKTLKQQNRQVKDRDEINSAFCLVLPEILFSQKFNFMVWRSYYLPG